MSSNSWSWSFAVKAQKQEIKEILESALEKG